MSVQVANPDFYDTVYRKLVFFENNKQVNINYNYSVILFSRKGGDIKQLIKDWLKLNELSYIRGYRDDLKGDKPNLESFLRFSSVKQLNPYATVKALEFIAYNIELSTIEHGCDSSIQDHWDIDPGLMDSYKWLNKILSDCKTAIIKDSEEYQNTPWGEI